MREPKKNIDIFHGHGAKGGIYARIMGVLHNAKSVYTPHGGSIHDSYGVFQTLMYRLIETVMYFITDKIVAESKYTEKQYKKALFIKSDNNDKKIVLNYNGIECQDLKENKHKTAPNTKPTIATFGMLRFEKGQDILILAAKELLERGYDITFNIFGDGKDRDFYQKMIIDYSLENHVFLQGETEKVENEMMKSDIIVQPSRFESFGYVLLEAMCAGVPVIASNVGGMTEILSHDVNGRLFENENHHDLANQIVYILENPNKKSDYIKEGKATVLNKFSSETMCNGLDIIYRNILK